MNIWYLSAYDQPNGQSSRTYDFARQFVRMGHKVTFFSNSFCHFTKQDRVSLGKSPFVVQYISGIRVVWLNTRAYNDNSFGRGMNMVDNYLAIMRASSSIDDEKPDVVIGPSVPTLTGWSGLRLSERYGVPFVFEVRDVWPDALVEIGGLSRRNPVYVFLRILEKKMYEKAAIISSVFPLLSEHVANSGADPSKLVYIPNGVDLCSYEPNPPASVHGDKINVMYVGGFGLDHDIESILYAASLIQEAGIESFHFNLYGDGARKDFCISLASSLGLKNLSIHGVVPKSDVPKLQSTADILIASVKATANFRYGLNLNKLCGYLPSCRPIIFSGNPPNDPVKQSGAGISVVAENPKEISHALIYLRDIGHEARMQMGKAGLTFASKHLSIQTLSMRYIDALQNILSKTA